MTAAQLIHHVFPWEIAPGVAAEALPDGVPAAGAPPVQEGRRDLGAAPAPAT